MNPNNGYLFDKYGVEEAMIKKWLKYDASEVEKHYLQVLGYDK